MIRGNIERLSSGYRINHAADDAAGLAISERFRTQVRGLEQALKNITDGISVIQTAEGALIEVHGMLQRMRLLAVQASNSTLTASDRRHIQVEIDEIIHEIDRFASTVNFNTIRLLNGDLSDRVNNNPTYKGSFIVHTGANENEIIRMFIRTISAEALGVKCLSSTDPDKNHDYLTREHAESAISIVHNAINILSKQRADLGAYQNRLEHTLNATGIARENMAASESRIRDLDVAAETADFTKNQILSQAGTAMLAQANTMPQTVLQLLG
jgi:flagellin